jgi:predicted MFS family arabinose efflux permease
MANVEGEAGGRGRVALAFVAVGRAGARALTNALGGAERTRVILLLAAVLGMSSADAATVGAAATPLRHALGINNTDIGLLVTVTSLVAAVASLPFGVLADRVRRTWTLGAAIVLWGAAMIWSATVSSFGELLLTRVFLGGVTAAAGPLVASLVGDYFASSERGRIYGYILAGELAGAGIGFSVTGDIAALSWRAAFVLLAIPAFVLAWMIFRLPEPARGARGALTPDGGPADPETSESDEHGTDAQRLARERGVDPDPELVLRVDPRRMRLLDAARYVLHIRTNVALIIASASGYYFLAGVQTFGVEFVTQQYGINQALGTLVLLVVGGGAIAGVLAGGAIGDVLLHRGYLSARISVSALAATAAVVLFAPAIFTRSAVTALPYVTFAALALSAQNPPLDAARLDIMVPLLWGRAEGVRTLLRTGAQALAPVVFGGVSDYVFGGGRSGLQWTFGLMLLPLGASAYFLYKALGTYPRDVATAAASAGQTSSPSSASFEPSRSQR